MGVARIFQGGGGVTLCQSEGTYQIVMSFLPPVVGCLLKKGLQKGGHRHPRTPLATPLQWSRLEPCLSSFCYVLGLVFLDT